MEHRTKYSSISGGHCLTHSHYMRNFCNLATSHSWRMSIPHTRNCPWVSAPGSREVNPVPTPRSAASTSWLIRPRQVQVKRHAQWRDPWWQRRCNRPPHLQQPHLPRQHNGTRHPPCQPVLRRRSCGFVVSVDLWVYRRIYQWTTSSRWIIVIYARSSTFMWHVRVDTLRPTISAVIAAGLGYCTCHYLRWVHDQVLTGNVVAPPLERIALCITVS